MPELGIPYVLTGPDGTRAVFNDPTDVDFVGYLDPETGITGLLDTAQVRESVVNKTEGHGVFQGDNWFARRVGTMNGFIVPPASMAALNLQESKLKRASRGMRGVSPATLTWTPSGGVPRAMSVWRQGVVGITGRRPKKFQIPLASSQAFTYSAALNSVTIVPNVAGGELGFTSPFSSPFKSVFNTSGQAFITNAGDADTFGTYTINGPLTNPTLLNNTTGLSWTLTLAIAAGEMVVVDSEKKSVQYLTPSGPGYLVSNRYGAYAANFATNTWWPLISGPNDIRLLTASFSAGAQAAVGWHDCWE